MNFNRENESLPPGEDKINQPIYLLISAANPGRLFHMAGGVHI
jgi:hypothetical protein